MPDKMERTKENLLKALSENRPQTQKEELQRELAKNERTELEKEKLLSELEGYLAKVSKVKAERKNDYLVVPGVLRIGILPATSDLQSRLIATHEEPRKNLLWHIEEERGCKHWEIREGTEALDSIKKLLAGIITD